MRRHHAENAVPRISANAMALAKSVNHGVPRNKRTRGTDRMDQGPFLPTEDWYEPGDPRQGRCKIILQQPGRGFRHAVTPKEVRQRLAQLPEWMIRPLEVVQLSRMTRKKQTFPCYGMQWGSTLYLYPIEENLIEEFSRPPRPSVYNEARMYGGRWEQLRGVGWRLIWTPETLRDFYLNNILIHELGHLLDDRNSTYLDRERFAEWFAIKHGYQATERKRLARLGARRLVRRHHRR